MSLRSIHVVLVRAENPSNIGAVARAMKNFGFKNLIVVNSADHRSEQAQTLGWKAKDILKNAKIFKNLKLALKNSSLTVGFTRRAGRHRGNGRLITDIVAQILEASESGNVFLMFGNEKNGLSNDELKHCHELVTIPTTKAYPSMNLSHAVAVSLYSIFSGTSRGKKLKKKPEEFYATPKEFEILMDDFYEALIHLHYEDIPKKNIVNQTATNIRNFFKKNGLEKREYHLFRAFLSRVLKRQDGNQKRLSGQSESRDGLQTEKLLSHFQE